MITNNIFTITEEELAKIKAKFDEEDMIDDEDLDDLKKKKAKSIKCSITFGNLFLTCYHYIHGNMYLLRNGEKALYDKLNKYFSEFNEVGRLRKLLEEYGDGEGYGCHYTKESIKDIVDLNREKMEGVINLFFMISKEEI